MPIIFKILEDRFNHIDIFIYANTLNVSTIHIFEIITISWTVRFTFVSSRGLFFFFFNLTASLLACVRWISTYLKILRRLSSADGFLCW